MPPRSELSNIQHSACSILHSLPALLIQHSAFSILHSLPLLLTALFLTAPFARAAAAPTPLLVIEPNHQYPRHSEGDVVELGGGSLALIYSRFTGGPADDATADIVMTTRSPATGKWDQPHVIVPHADAQNVMSVSTVRLSDHEWLLCYLRKGDAFTNCHLLVRRTTDEFRTLSDPVRATVVDGYHVVNNDRVIRLASGRLVVPSAMHPCPDGTRKTWSPKATCMAFLSDDNGRTWRRAAEPVPAPADKSVALQEPGVFEMTEPNKLCMWMRTSTNRQYQSFSSDGGEHWTVPEPGPLISAQFSPASIHRIPWTGDLLAVWNDHSAHKDKPSRLRTPLSVAISHDDGKTWSKSRPIETDPEGWYCYTSITFTRDQTILSYCAGNKKLGSLNRLKVLTIDRNWLLDR